MHGAPARNGEKQAEVFSIILQKLKYKKSRA